jgi:hypothetical protein
MPRGIDLWPSCIDSSGFIELGAAGIIGYRFDEDGVAQA